MSAQPQFGRPLRALRSWFGGWSLLLLVVVVIGVAAGLYWESQRHPPLPDGAMQVTTSLIGDVRQTTFRYAGSVAQVRSFYQQALAQRGWRYCGTAETAHCTNLTSLADDIDQQTDVYRRADDRDYRGSTVEIRPINTNNGQIYVTMFETRSK